MSPEHLPPLEIRVSRRTAETLGMPRLCPRRACRRTGRCAAPVSAEGEPECVGSLREGHRNLFASQRTIAGLCAARFSGRELLPEPENDEEAFILRQCVCTAVAALAEEPANRPALRGWLRRLRLPPATPPPRSIAHEFETFGERVPDEEDALAGDG